MTHIGQRVLVSKSGEDQVSTEVLSNGYLYAGVFDGHNGKQAAIFCADNFPSMLNTEFQLNKSTQDALKTTFQNAHNAVPDKSGTTATVLIINDTHVYIAHVGDSRAIKTQQNSPVQLTDDHHVKLESEKTRLEEAEVKHKRKFIYGQRVEGLMVTRSIGDKILTNQILSEPVICEFDINNLDDFLVIATDGLWDLLSNTEVAEFVHKNRNETVDKIASLLVDEALSKSSGRTDDIAVVVVPLQ